MTPYSLYCIIQVSENTEIAVSVGLRLMIERHLTDRKSHIKIKGFRQTLSLALYGRYGGAQGRKELKKNNVRTNLQLSLRTDFVVYHLHYTLTLFVLTRAVTFNL